MIEELKPKSNSLADLQDYISDCSSVVRDKQPKSSAKLWDRLLVESVGDKPSRVFEYIPCAIELKKRSKKASQLFGFKKGKLYYTNARELFMWGWTLDQVLEHVTFTNYKVFKCQVPYFIYGQISTHNQLTTVSHSQRYSECDRGYWKPPEVSMKQDQWDIVVSTRARPKELQDVMKNSGIVRKEVWDRGRDMLQNRVFTIGGFTNNPNAWEHFLLQRTDNHTQYETRQFVEELSQFF